MNIVNACWHLAASGNVFIPIQLRNKGGVFVDREPMPVEKVRDPRWSEALWDQPPDTDLYFTPLSFRGKKRRNEEAVAPMRVLYADLDPVPPSSLAIKPSAAWETSPGSYQAVWYLSKGVSRERFRDLNQRLTYWAGADRGGWMESKVLRVPGSINWKRGGVEGQILWATRRLYDPAWLDAQLPKAGEGTLPDSPTSSTPKPLSRTEWDDVLKDVGERVGPGTRWLMTKARVDDRSIHIWKVSQALAREGVSAEDAFQVLWHMPYNKYRQQQRADRLWLDIQRAYSASI